MSNYTHCLPSNPDISGIGDKKITPLELDSLETQSTTILITAFAILVSVIVQALKRGLTNYHAAIILNLSWMNNTNLFIYFLLYVFHHTTELPADGRGQGGKRVPLRSIWTESGQTKKAWKNPVFIIGSVHLSIMSAVGIWLWSQPAAFGNSKPCSLSASLVVVGQTVPIGSHSLREWSLLAYSLLLTPALNLIIPIGFFAVPVWIYGRFTTISLNREAGIKLTRAGLAMLAVIDVLLLADTEVSIRKNRHLTEDGDTEWTFGQTLAILLLLIPLRDIGEALVERRPRRLGEKLLVAAGKGQLHVVQDAMKSGASRTIIYPATITSIQSGHWEIVELLVEATANLEDTYAWLEAASACGQLNLSVNALFSAAEKQQVQTVKLLAKLLGSINTSGTSESSGVCNNITLMFMVDENGQTALHSAARCGNLDTVRLLAKLHADMNATDKDGWTALHYAAYDGSIEIVELLCELNADMRLTAKDGRTALELAATQGKTYIVGYLVQPSIDLDLNGRGWYVWASLQYIADTGNMEVSRFLNADRKDMRPRVKKWEADFLQHLNELAGNRDDGNVGYSDYRYALHQTAEQGHIEVLKFLIEIGVDLNATDSKCWAALHYAADKRHTEAVKLLAAHGADLNVRGHRRLGLTPLHRAAEEAHFEIVKLLAELGADLHLQCKNGYTALHYAAAQDQSAGIIELLAMLKADIHAKSVEGGTPLHMAALHGNLEGVKTLIELKADFNAKSNSGYTPFHFAAMNGHLEIVKFLAELQVDMNAKCQDGKAALHSAATYGRSEVVKLLVELGVDVNATDENGQTPLHWLALSSSGNADLAAKSLVEAGVDPDARDHDGKSALDIALSWEGSKVLDFLSNLQAEANGKGRHDSQTTC